MSQTHSRYDFLVKLFNIMPGGDEDVEVASILFAASIMSVDDNIVGICNGQSQFEYDASNPETFTAGLLSVGRSAVSGSHVFRALFWGSLP